MLVTLGAALAELAVGMDRVVTDEVTMLMSVLRAWQQSGVQLKTVSFFSRLVRGLAKPAKFRMKGH